MFAEETDTDRRNRTHRGVDHGEQHIQVVNHEVEHDADIGRTECVRGKPLGIDELGADRHLLECAQSRIESLDMADLQDGPAGAGVFDESFRLGSGRSHRLFHQCGDASREEWAGHFAVQDGGDRDGDGVYEVEHRSVVAEPSCAALRCDRLSLLSSRIGDGDELDARHCRENSRVVLAQVADAHDSDAQRCHLVLPRSLALPCLPRCWLSMNASRLCTSGQ
jgi:hypothetical protein